MSMSLKNKIEYLAEKEYPLKVVSVMEGYEDANRFERDAFIKGLTYKQILEDNAEISIKFAVWIAENKFEKKTHTHPNKIGKWFSNNNDLGFLTDEELYKYFVEKHIYRDNRIL